MSATKIETDNKTAKRESFAELFGQTLASRSTIVGTVVPGKVISVTKDSAIIDIDLKTEGKVPLGEFALPDQEPPYVKEGDIIDVFVDKIENKDGELVLSREKARREEAWFDLQALHEKGEKVIGQIVSRVKGGFTVNLMGAMAFLPRSQVDIRPLRDIDSLKDQDQYFQILKMDRSRNNIVISRRAVLEETRAEQRDELVKNLHEGQILEGIIKNITDYGAFIDLGGVDGLLHVTDISWKRLNHPSEMLTVGESIKIVITRFNAETGRVSLGLKQLEDNPWDRVIETYKIGTKVNGNITNITDYGAFVELEPGIEGLVHVSEIGWGKRNIHPRKIVSTSQEVEVMVLDIDLQKRRIALGMKQCHPNPWEIFAETATIGDIFEGTIRNITDFALFVALTEDIDGMVHTTDLDWSSDGKEALQNYKKGDSIKVKLLAIEIDKERVFLGIKQIATDPFVDMTKNMKKGDVVTSIVSKTHDKGIEVTIGDSIPGFIRRSDLAKDRTDQRSDRFAEGEKLDAQVVSIDKKLGRVILSVKMHENEEQKKAMETYGSSDSGAVLGDILGRALEEKKSAKQVTADVAEEKDKKVEKATADVAEEKDKKVEKATADVAEEKDKKVEKATADVAEEKDKKVEKATSKAKKDKSEEDNAKKA